MKTKICKGKSGCNIKKPLNKFVRDTRAKDGHGSICLECRRKVSNTYRNSNPKKMKECRENWVKNNPEKKKLLTKIYKDKNRKETNKKGREYYHNNLERERQRNRNYRINNPEKARARKRKRRAMKKFVNGKYTALDEKVTYIVFGHKCFNCDSTNNLSIDHHYCLNDGNPLSVSNAVVLCMQCNSSKGTKSPDKFYTVSKLKEITKLFKIAEAL